MIELKQDCMVFSFPEVHPEAKLTIALQRTLRIPDDGESYPLPPGLGNFPLKHVDDFAERLPQSWRHRGGVMMPMYQSEALWLNFNSNHIANRGTAYPFSIKIATGKINAVTGSAWSESLCSDDQDYLVAPEQLWLDGYCIEKGFIRQFVAMPLGAGYTAEEQLTGKAEFGGLQLKVYPMQAEEFERRFPERKIPKVEAEACYSSCNYMSDLDSCFEMGTAPGGLMKQEIATDPYGVEAWDDVHSSRCFVHLCNSLVWESITGKCPPSPPITAADYSRRGLPWFEHYNEQPSVAGSEKLKGLNTVKQTGQAKGDQPLPENESAHPENIQVLQKKYSKDQVREGGF